MRLQERRDGALRPRYDWERNGTGGKLRRTFICESIGEHNDRSLRVRKNDSIYKRTNIKELGIRKRGNIATPWVLGGEVPFCVESWVTPCDFQKGNYSFQCPDSHFEHCFSLLLCTHTCKHVRIKAARLCKNTRKSLFLPCCVA